MFEIFLFVLLLWVSVVTTLFPVLYAFTPWYRSVLGRIMMANGIAFAFTVDMTLVFNFFATELPKWLYLTISIGGFTAIGLTMTAMSGYLAMVYARTIRYGSTLSETLEDE